MGIWRKCKYPTHWVIKCWEMLHVLHIPKELISPSNSLEYECRGSIHSSNPFLKYIPTLRIYPSCWFEGSNVTCNHFEIRAFHVATIHAPQTYQYYGKCDIAFQKVVPIGLPQVGALMPLPAINQVGLDVGRSILYLITCSRHCFPAVLHMLH